MSDNVIARQGQMFETSTWRFFTGKSNNVWCKTDVEKL